MKYQQKYIPCVNSLWKEKTASELRKIVLQWYRTHLAGKKVTNNCLGIPVFFSVSGGKKLAMGSAIYFHKAELVRELPAILEHACYSNWGDRKTTDHPSVIGYLNFKCKVQIDGSRKHLRIAVRMQKDGKLYWNHEINMMK